MQPELLPDHLREQVKKAVTHYAHFYSELVNNHPEGAEAQISAITFLDASIRENEDEEQFLAYFERRSQLMRIFHFQLMKSIEGQVQKDVLEQAETLLSKLEIIRE